MPASAANAEALLRTNEVARRLSVSVETVYRLAQSGRLSAIRLKPTGPLRFRHEDVEALIEQGRADDRRAGRVARKRSWRGFLFGCDPAGRACSRRLRGQGWRLARQEIPSRRQFTSREPASTEARSLVVEREHGAHLGPEWASVRECHLKLCCRGLDGLASTGGRGAVEDGGLFHR